MAFLKKGPPRSDVAKSDSDQAETGKETESISSDSPSTDNSSSPSSKRRRVDLEETETQIEPDENSVGEKQLAKENDTESNDTKEESKHLTINKKEMQRFDKMLEEYATTNRNMDSCCIESDVPEICFKTDCWMGIDEAGRGPVCGPMNYGIAYGPINEAAKLKSMGFADSKQLSEAQRDNLWETIKKNDDFLGWIISALSPQDISMSMLGKSNYNLNAMSHDTAIHLIRRVLALGVQLTEVYVDTVGKEEWYQAKLENLFPDLKITVTSKADVKFPIVSAASICAKVSRDAILNNWRYSEGLDKLSRVFGSGYPGDPNCKKWLVGATDPIFGFPGVARFSWSTVKKILDESCAKVSWEDDEDDSETPSVMTFFSKKSEGVDKKRRHRFFQNASLKVVTDF